MNVDNNNLDMFDTGWIQFLIKTNSSFYGELEDKELGEVMTLYNYIKIHQENFSKNMKITPELKYKLEQYYIQEIKTKDANGDEGIDKLLVDSKGVDIAKVYIKDMQEEVELSPEIIKNNMTMLGKASISEDFSRIEIASIEDLNKIMEVTFLEDIVEEIDKYDHVKYFDREDTRNRIMDLSDRDKAKAGVGGALKEKNSQYEKEENNLEGEKKLDKDRIEKNTKQLKVSGTQFSMIVKICEENGLDPANLKQIAEIRSPKDIIEDINNERTKISPTGGTVTVLRFKNADAGSLDDKIFMMQGGDLLPQDDSNNDKVSLFLDYINSKNTVIYNFNDPREKEVLERIAEMKIEYDMQVKQIKETNSVNTKESKKELLDRLTDSYKEKVEEMLEAYDPEVTNNKKIESDAIDDLEGYEDIAEDEIEELDIPEDEEEYNHIPEEHKIPEGPWDKRKN